MEHISSYGVIKPERLEDGSYRVLSLVEKPSPDKAPSNLAILGRYALTPEIFRELERAKPGAKGEIQLTDGIAGLLQSQQVFARVLRSTGYDMGTPHGLLMATLELASQREDTGPMVRAWAKRLLGQ